MPLPQRFCLPKGIPSPHVPSCPPRSRPNSRSFLPAFPYRTTPKPFARAFSMQERISIPTFSRRRRSAARGSKACMRRSTGPSPSSFSTPNRRADATGASSRLVSSRRTSSRTSRVACTFGATRTAAPRLAQGACTAFRTASSSTVPSLRPVRTSCSKPCAARPS